MGRYCRQVGCSLVAVLLHAGDILWIHRFGAEHPGKLFFKAAHRQPAAVGAVAAV